MRRLLISFAALSLIASTAFAGHHDSDKDHTMYKQNHFNSIDIDGNGGVSMDEFMAKHSKMFSKIDTDGNGELSQEEVNKHHHMRKGKKGHEGEKGHEGKKDIE